MSAAPESPAPVPRGGPTPAHSAAPAGLAPRRGDCVTGPGVSGRRRPVAVPLGLGLAFALAATQARGQEPPQPATGAVPAGATARCRDGTYSSSGQRSGTCAHHGGVAAWLDPTVSTAPARGDSAVRCGRVCVGFFRWAVKTLSDSDRARVRLQQPVNTTIAALVALPRPEGLSATGRADPVELTLYRVEARVLQRVTEVDRDYHMIVADPRDTTITMIAEIPDPECGGACASGFAARYRAARRKLLERINAAPAEAQPLVVITGVGFFDYLHFQRGAAPTGIELHPILDIEFP